MMNAKQMINAYQTMTMDYLDYGAELFLLTFMFRNLRGSPSIQLSQMEKGIEHVYALLLPHVIRNPRKTKLDALPIWIAAPDRPVSKHARKSLGSVSINDGLHMHALCLIPPFNRLKRGFADEVRVHHDNLVTMVPSLYRLDAVWVTETAEFVVDYALKGLKRPDFNGDHVLILPRAHSEMLSRKERFVDG